MVGDSYCRFSIFSLNSSLVGRVGVSAHSASSELLSSSHERTGLLSGRDQVSDASEAASGGRQLTLRSLLKVVSAHLTNYQTDQWYRTSADRARKGGLVACLASDRWVEAGFISSKSLQRAVRAVHGRTDALWLEL